MTLYICNYMCVCYLERNACFHVCVCVCVCLRVNVHSSSWGSKACRPRHSPKLNKLRTSTSKTLFCRQVRHGQRTLRPSLLACYHGIQLQSLNSSHTRSVQCCLDGASASGSVAEHQRECGRLCACKQRLGSEMIL